MSLCLPPLSSGWLQVGLDSSLEIILVTMVARLSSLTSIDLRGCSLLSLLIKNSFSWVLNSAWLASKAVMRADILPEAACCTHHMHKQE